MFSAHPPGTCEPGNLDERVVGVRPCEECRFYDAPVFHSNHKLLHGERGSIAPGTGRYLSIDLGQVGLAVRVGMIDHASRMFTFQAFAQGKQVFGRKDVRGLDAAAGVGWMAAIGLHVDGEVNFGRGPSGGRAAQPAAALTGKRGSGVVVYGPEGAFGDVDGG